MSWSFVSSQLLFACVDKHHRWEKRSISGVDGNWHKVKTGANLFVFSGVCLVGFLRVACVWRHMWTPVQPLCEQFCLRSSPATMQWIRYSICFLIVVNTSRIVHIAIHRENTLRLARYRPSNDLRSSCINYFLVLYGTDITICNKQSHCDSLRYWTTKFPGVSGYSYVR